MAFFHTFIHTGLLIEQDTEEKRIKNDLRKGGSRIWTQVIAARAIAPAHGV